MLTLLASIAPPTLHCVRSGMSGPSLPSDYTMKTVVMSDTGDLGSPYRKYTQVFLVILLAALISLVWRILAFVRRASRPVISDIPNQRIYLSEFTSSDDITFAAEFLPSEASLYEWQYRNLARQYHDRYSFAILP